MIELTQEEKDRIRAELEYRAAVAQELHPPSTGWKRFSEGLTHPIIVTVIGGMLVAGVGAYLQDNFSENQAENTHKRQIQDKKLSIVANLPVQLYKDIALIQNRSYLRFDLEAWKRNRAHIGYLGRTRKEVLTTYNKLVDEFIKSPRQAPLLSEVKSWFCEKDVLDRASQIDDQIRAFSELTAAQLTEQNIQQFGLTAEKKLNDLVAVMVVEVKNPPLKCMSGQKAA